MIVCYCVFEKERREDLRLVKVPVKARPAVRMDWAVGMYMMTARDIPVPIEDVVGLQCDGAQ